MYRHVILIAVILAAVAVAGCVQEETPVYPEYQPLDFSGSIEVIAMGYDVETHIDNAGYINSTLLTQGAGNAYESVQMTTNQFNELKHLVDTSGFFGLEANYINWTPDDGTTFILDLTLGNRTNWVRCYEMCPDAIISIREKVAEYIANNAGQ